MALLAFRDTDPCFQELGRAAELSAWLRGHGMPKLLVPAALRPWLLRLFKHYLQAKWTEIGAGRLSGLAAIECEMTRSRSTDPQRCSSSFNDRRASILTKKTIAVFASTSLKDIFRCSGPDLVGRPRAPIRLALDLISRRWS
jgi:hypothetical protein